MKKAICIGINNYPGTSSDLQGCVNDANDWSALLQEFGFETSLLLEAQATRQNIKAALEDLVLSATEGDVIVFSYSGHGTQSIDFGGDEGDFFDEALSVYDGNIPDDDLRVIINKIDPRATLVVISDSCFSGSVTRLIPENTKPRFLPTDGLSEERAEERMVRQRFLLPEAGMPEILISGCSDSEYSYDAEINGRYNGAMSAMAIRAIRQNRAGTYNDFYTSLRATLPSSEFPQTPQLEGTGAHKNTLLFEPFEYVSEPGPTPTPEPDDSPGCVPGLLRQVTQLFKSG